MKLKAKFESRIYEITQWSTVEQKSEVRYVEAQESLSSFPQVKISCCDMFQKFCGCHAVVCGSLGIQAQKSLLPNFQEFREAVDVIAGSLKSATVGAVTPPMLTEATERVSLWVRVVRRY